MANNHLCLCAFKLRNMLSFAYGHAMPIDTIGIHRGLTAGFTVIAHGISVPISWGSPPILERMNR